MQMTSVTLPLAPDTARSESSARAAARVSRIVMLGATSIVIGILWDISWHRTIGRDTFWTPAHLAIQLGGLLGGCTAGWLAFHTTFFGTAEEKAGAVKLWGFRAPIGAWVTIWGCLAMLISAPFDNWWHDAYGLDVKILSPPHTVLALGMWAVVLGALLLVLREQNNGVLSLSLQRGEGRELTSREGSRFVPLNRRTGVSPVPPSERDECWTGETPVLRGGSWAGKQESVPGRWFFIYGGGVLLAMASVFLIETSFPNHQHAQTFYRMSAATYPLYLVGFARAAKFRWSATLIALVYMLIVALMAWALPLFPGSPKLGPIMNHVDHFVPLPFPLLLVVPAFAIDLIRLWLGAGRGWRRDALIVLLSALAFVALFALTQWHFSKFLIGPGGQNWFFAADRHWGYTEKIADWRRQFWDEVKPLSNAAVTWRTFGVAGLYALISSSVGLALGNWMAKVRR